MRHIIVGLAAVLLLTPATRSPAAGAAAVRMVETADFSAAKKKKKATMRKAKNKKEQYMRAIPSK